VCCNRGVPKIVDHERRRETLARTVREIISREGIEGATVRRVAQEAGTSVGGLRHYFDSQSGLLAFAAEEVGRSLVLRIDAWLARDLPGPERARLLLEELLPLDAERRVEVDVWLACLMRSRVDDSLAGLRATAWQAELHVCRLALACHRSLPLPARIGEPFGDPGLEARAARLHVFLDGLTLQTAMFPERFTPQGLRALVGEVLAEA
jgi:AcrR family transcriptional regulator